MGAPPQTMLLSGLALLALLQTGSSFLLPSFMELGYCSQVQQMEGFDYDKFAGNWYTILLVENEFVTSEHCILTNYTKHSDHVMFTERALDKDRQEVFQEQRLDLDPSMESSFLAIGKGMRPTVHLTVLDTDYIGYSCLYTCFQKFAFRGEFAWVRSRYPHLDKKSVEKCKQTIRENQGMDLDKLVFVEQGESCPYWEGLAADERHKPVRLSGLDIGDPSKFQAIIADSVQKDMEEAALLNELLYYEDIPSAGAHATVGGPTAITTLVAILTAAILLRSINRHWD